MLRICAPSFPRRSRGRKGQQKKDPLTLTAFVRFVLNVVISSKKLGSRVERSKSEDLCLFLISELRGLLRYLWCVLCCICAALKVSTIVALQTLARYRIDNKEQHK